MLIVWEAMVAMSTTKIFLSHSWEDTNLVRHFKRMLDVSSAAYEIGSVECNNPIRFPSAISEVDAALDEINSSIAGFERQLQVLMNEKAKLERDLRIVRDPQRLLAEKNVSALLRRFEERMRPLQSDTQSNPEMESRRRKTEDAEFNADVRKAHIDLALSENKQISDAVIRKLRYLNLNRVGIVRSKLDHQACNPAARLDFRTFSAAFGKRAFSEMHPSLREMPTALLSALASRVCEADVFIILFTENHFFSIWSHLELDICFKVRAPSICIDASVDASAPAYLKLMDEYILWNQESKIVDAIQRLTYGWRRSEWRESRASHLSDRLQCDKP
jgi:hypothetical protein